MPCVQRQDLTDSKKVDALRKRRDVWQQTGLTQSFYVPFPPGRIHIFRFVDGTSACGYSENGTNTDLAHGPTRLIRFDQLPSSNRGTEHKSWSHKLEFDAVSFAIDPEQDLLVLLQQLEYMPDGETGVLRESYKVHIRTISTNEPHPIATLPDGMVLELEHPVDGPEPFGIRNKFHIRICQSLVAVKLGRAMSRLTPYLTIWDWVTGQKLACIITPGDGNEEPLFGFISKDYVAIPRPADRSQGGCTTMGHLDIHQVAHTKGAIPNQARDRVAYLELPIVDGHATLELHSTPTQAPTISTSNTPAKIYEPRSGGYMRLDCNMYRRLGPVGSAARVRFCGSLFVSSPMLLDVLDKRLTAAAGSGHENFGLATPIPWESWRHSTCFIDRRFSFRSPGWSPICTPPQGLAFLEHVTVRTGFRPSVIILDYDTRRLRARETGKCKFTGNIYSLDSKPPNKVLSSMGIENALEEAFVGTNSNMHGYVQRSFKIPEPGATTRYAVALDEEHVMVVASGESNSDDNSSTQRGLYAYTI